VIGRISIREQERIELVWRHLGDPALGTRDFLPVLACELGVGSQTDHDHSVTCGGEGVVRLAELGVLEVVVE
jgi:hypothetical protein